jgi:hypothetical protein
VDKLEVRWPSGARETVSINLVDCVLTVGEGKGLVKQEQKSQ